MGDNDKPPMPRQPTTVALEVPPSWAIALTEKVTTGFANVNDKVDSLTTSVEVLQHDAKDTRLRLGRMEREVDEVKSRQNDGSMRVRATSENDLKQDSAIATIVVDVSELKRTQGQQLAILERLDKVAANPMVRRVAYAIGSAILFYLASKGWLAK